MADFLHEARRWAATQGGDAASGSPADAAPTDDSRAAVAVQREPASLPAEPLPATAPSTAPPPASARRRSSISRADADAAVAVERMRAAAAEQAARADAAEARCVALEQALERYSQQGAALESQLETLGSAVREELAKMSDEADTAQARIAALEAALSASQQQVAALSANAAAVDSRWEKEAATLRVELANQRAIASACALERDDALARCKALETRSTMEVGAVADERVVMQREMDRMREQLETAHREVERLQATLAASAATGAGSMSRPQRGGGGEADSGGGSGGASRSPPWQALALRDDGAADHLSIGATAAAAAAASPAGSYDGGGDRSTVWPPPIAAAVPSPPPPQIVRQAGGAAALSGSAGGGHGGSHAAAASRTTRLDGAHPEPPSLPPSTSWAAVPAPAPGRPLPPPAAAAHAPPRHNQAPPSSAAAATMARASVEAPPPAAAALTTHVAVVVTDDGSDSGSATLPGVSVDALPGAGLVRVVDRGVQRLFRADTVVSVGGTTSPAPSPRDGRSAAAAAGTQSAASTAAFAPVLRSVDDCVVAATRMAPFAPARGGARSAVPPVPAAPAAIILIAAPPSAIDAALRDAHARVLGRLFTGLHNVRGGAGGVPAGGLLDVSVSVSLLDVYGDTIRDALAVRKAATPHTAAAINPTRSGYIAPSIQVGHTATSPTTPTALAATRVEVATANDAELVVRAGLHSRALLYGAPSPADLASSGDGAATPLQVAAATAARSPHRGHAVIVLRLARKHTGSGAALPSVKLFIVALATPGWVASGVLPLAAGEAACLQLESAHAARAMQCLTDTWRAARTLATPEVGGGAGAAVAQGPARAALDRIVRSHTLTTALADGFGALSAGAPLALHLHVSLPSRLAYMCDADAVSQLMMANDVATPSAGATARSGDGAGDGVTGRGASSQEPRAAGAAGARGGAAGRPGAAATRAAAPAPRPHAASRGDADASAIGLRLEDASSMSLLVPRSLLFHEGGAAPGGVGGTLAAPSVAGAPSTISIAGSGPASTAAASAARKHARSGAASTTGWATGDGGAPLYAPPREGGRRPGSLSRGYYLSTGTPAPGVASVGTVTPARSRSRSLEGNASFTAAASAAAGASRGRASRRSSIASQASSLLDLTDHLPQRVHTAHGDYVVAPASLPISDDVEDVDARGGINAYVDPRLRRLLLEHERRLRAYGDRPARGSSGSRASVGGASTASHGGSGGGRKGDGRGYVALGEYLAADGPAAAARALVSPEVFDGEMQAARARRARVAIAQQRRTASGSRSGATTPSGGRGGGSGVSTSRTTPSSSRRGSTVTLPSTVAVPASLLQAQGGAAAASFAASRRSPGHDAALDLVRLDDAIEREVSAQAALASAAAAARAGYPSALAFDAASAPSTVVTPRTALQVGQSSAAAGATPPEQPTPLPSPAGGGGDAEADADELTGDPVPGMHALLAALRPHVAGVGARGSLPASAFSALLGSLAAVDTARSGRLDSDGFALGLRRFCPALSWAQVDELLGAMHVRSLAAIDYPDFVHALQSLASAESARV